MPSDYLGDEVPMAIESEVIVATARKLRGDWTVQISTDGWPIYRRLPAALSLSAAQQLDSRQWPLGVDGQPLYLTEITDLAGLVNGEVVVWKDSPLDYLYAFGTVCRHV